MKSDQPLLSIILPVFNGADTLPRALESILQQSGAVLQIIVVDDGSTDNSATIASQTAPNAICVQQTNHGPAAARNRGLSLARGEFISFLDADDYWPAGRVQHHMAQFQQHPGADIVIGTTQMVRLALDDATSRPILPAPLIQHNFGSATYRRGVFEHVGTFDDALYIGEDKKWFQRAMRAGITFQMSPDVALVYQLREGSLTYGTIDHGRWFLAALRSHLRHQHSPVGAGVLPPSPVGSEKTG